MEGTKETFPLTFDPVTVQPTRAWVCYMGGEGQSHPSLFIILLFLPQPIPPLSSPPFICSFRQRRDVVCWRTQVKRLCLAFCFVSLNFFFYKIIISLHTEQKKICRILITTFTLKTSRV